MKYLTYLYSLADFLGALSLLGVDIPEHTDLQRLQDSMHSHRLCIWQYVFSIDLLGKEVLARPLLDFCLHQSQILPIPLVGKKLTCWTVYLIGTNCVQIYLLGLCYYSLPHQPRCEGIVWPSFLPGCWGHKKNSRKHNIPRVSLPLSKGVVLPLTSSPSAANTLTVTSAVITSLIPSHKMM